MDPFVKAGDINGAKKSMEALQKLDPSRPEAYQRLAVCFEISGQTAECRACMEEACKRWALIALTGQKGAVLRSTLRAKPDWWCHGGMLKRVTKVALTAAKAGLEDPKVAVYYSHSPTEDTIGALENMRVQALSGCNGQQAIPVTRKEEEIEETKRMFRGALENVEGEAKSDMLLRMHNVLKQMTAEQTNASALECGEAGLWVLVHGLSCQTGQPLNGKL
ncbi:expressed unknown protein [Seminavis robusta]|uniref:Uncharacterized protein n=1 Tax=Seminavis robusta TaxID=568900 RepID=A0A9N8EHL4_9STRA|nr:expressed unknown protein [Seminavis robusta]|eukprot:Sro1094_g240470.1 n/a (220) ;mRNA; f:1827-2560